MIVACFVANELCYNNIELLGKSISDSIGEGKTVINSLEDNLTTATTKSSIAITFGTIPSTLDSSLDDHSSAVSSLKDRINLISYIRYGNLNQLSNFCFIF
jgi:hypothetical protein